MKVREKRSHELLASLGWAYKALSIRDRKMFCQSPLHPSSAIQPPSCPKNPTPKKGKVKKKDRPLLVWFSSGYVLVWLSLPISFPGSPHWFWLHGSMPLPAGPFTGQTSWNSWCLFPSLDPSLILAAWVCLCWPDHPLDRHCGTLRNP